MNELKYVGKSIQRDDALAKVTGRAHYIDDLRFPGMLKAKILYSKYAHAKILQVDTTKAEMLPGVVAVVTGKDFPHSYYGPNIADQTIFATEKVRYLGDAVAAVAAIDDETAQKAIELINVEYEELPAIFDPVLAMKSNAPLVHEQLSSYKGFVQPVEGTNICNHFEIARGDLEKGFSSSDIITEDTFETPSIQNCPIEPHGVIAQVDYQGRINVWSSTQSPYIVRLELADIFGVTQNKVRVVVPFLGGGFGCKTPMRIEGQCAALAFKARGKPVKLVLTREEVFQSSVVRLFSKIHLKTGVKKDGTILAMKSNIIWDIGPYSDFGAGIAGAIGVSAVGPYNISNIKVDSYAVYTNNLNGGAYRSFGVSQVTWAIESNIDLIASKLNIDPVEIRLKNCYKEGSSSVIGKKLSSVALDKTIKAVASELKWHLPKQNKRGRGISCSHKYSSGLPSYSTVIIKINEDGSIGILASISEMGQGVVTVLKQIAAEELGVQLDRIFIAPTDTDVTPYDWNAVSSRLTFTLGNALRAAATDVKSQLFERASVLLNVDKNQLKIENGEIYNTEAVEQKVSFEDIVMGKEYLKVKQWGPIIGKGVYGIDGTTGGPFCMYATHGAEVEVNKKTGQIKVLKIVAAHDIGKAINPIHCEGQIEGGVIMGLGSSLTEELIMDQGKLQNNSLKNYELLTALDIPEIKTILIEDPHPDGPYGAKGIGEIAMTPLAAAIGNAVYDAVGVRIKNIPLTSEKIFKALKQKK